MSRDKKAHTIRKRKDATDFLPIQEEQHESILLNNFLKNPTKECALRVLDAAVSSDDEVFALDVLSFIDRLQQQTGDEDIINRLSEFAQCSKDHKVAESALNRLITMSTTNDQACFELMNVHNKARYYDIGEKALSIVCDRLPGIKDIEKISQFVKVVLKENNEIKQKTISGLMSIAIEEIENAAIRDSVIKNIKSFNEKLVSDEIDNMIKDIKLCHEDQDKAIYAALVLRIGNPEQIIKCLECFEFQTNDFGVKLDLLSSRKLINDESISAARLKLTSAYAIKEAKKKLSPPFKRGRGFSI